MDNRPGSEGGISYLARVSIVNVLDDAGGLCGDVFRVSTFNS